MKTINSLFVFALLIPMKLAAQQATWELVRSDFWGKIAIDPSNSDIIYVSPGHVPEFGLHKSTDGGKTWVNYQQGYEGLSENISGIVIDPNNSQRLWVYGGPGIGVVRSENGGITAVRADTGIVYDHHGYAVTAFAYDHIRDILYAGDYAIFGGIYRSFDGGRRWQQVVFDGVNLMFAPQFFLVIVDSGWVYSGSLGSGIWRSKDFGITWTPLHPEVFAGQNIASIARVPNSRALYAAGGLGTDYSPGKIYKSFDLGESWFLTSDTVTDSSDLSGGVIASSLDTNYVYVGGKGGATILKGGFFFSRNTGSNWQLYHFGLPQYELWRYKIWSIAQTPNSSYIYISVLFSIGDPSKYGVYRLSQDLLTPIQKHPSSSVPPNFFLLRNYPNPFNTQTKIEFSAPVKETVTLDVYDLFGQNVVSLFKGKIETRSHSVSWNGKDSKGGDVANGIYFIRLQARRQTLIRKMLLIR